MVPCFVEYHTKVNLLCITLFVNTVCPAKTVIQGATNLMQQPELCDKLTIYTTFYIMHAIHRPKFVIKIGEHFFPD